MIKIISFLLESTIDISMSCKSMVSRLTNMKIIAVFEKKNENYISTKLKGGQYNIGAAGTGRSVFEKWVLAFPSKFLPQLSFSI